MIKDHIRDYASAAFAFWVAAGRPCAAELETVKHFTPCELLDITAVENSIHMLERGGHSDISRAALSVYGECLPSRVRRGDISRAVIRYTMSSHRSEACVYRELAAARALFASFRGLRLDTKNRELADKLLADAVLEHGNVHDAACEH